MAWEHQAGLGYCRACVADLVCCPAQTPQLLQSVLCALWPTWEPALAARTAAVLVGLDPACWSTIQLGMPCCRMHLPCFCRVGTVETPPRPHPSTALGSHSPSEVDAQDAELNMGPNFFRPAASLLVASSSNAAAAKGVHLGPNPFQDVAWHAPGSSDGAAATKAGAPQAMRRQHGLSFEAAGGSPGADGLLPELKVPHLGLQASAGGPWQPPLRKSLSFSLAEGSPEAGGRPGADSGAAQSGSLLPSSLPGQATMKRSLSFKPGTSGLGPVGMPGEAAGRPAAELDHAEQGPQLPKAGLGRRQSLSQLGVGSPEVNRPLPEVAGVAELGPLLSVGGPRRSAMKGARGKAASELAGGASLQPAAAPQVVASAGRQPAATSAPTLRLPRLCPQQVPGCSIEACASLDVSTGAGRAAAANLAAVRHEPAQ